CMAWRSMSDLADEFTNAAFLKKFGNVWNLKTLLGACIMPPSYVVAPGISEAVQLTSSGTERIEKLKKRFPSSSDASLRLALFGSLYHHDLYIDVKRTDVLRIRQIIDA